MDIALVVPSANNRAKDLGMINNAKTLPKSLPSHSPTLPLPITHPRSPQGDHSVPMVGWLQEPRTPCLR